VNLTDYPGYHARRDEVDTILLALATDPEGYRLSEGDAALFAAGIGDARTAHRLELSASSTGAMHRAASRDLQLRGLVRCVLVHTGEPFEMVTGHISQPGYLSTRITRAGRIELQRLTQQQKAS
jgi:hypothetical protein